MFFNCPTACLTSLYGACDMFLSPADSLTESFGLTIVEAMACGRAVVASDWNGYRELIVHGTTGFRIRTDWADCLGELDVVGPSLHVSSEQEHLHSGQSVSVDVGEMSSFIVQLLVNRDLREEMGRHGRARAVQLYAWPVVIERWEALWRELGAIARTLDRREEALFDYLESRYFRHFAHYATRIVDEATPLRITSRGRASLADNATPPIHPGARCFLAPRHMRAILAALNAARWVPATVTVGLMVRLLATRRGLTRDQALMHVMWLAKYEMVSFGDAGAGGDHSCPGSPPGEGVSP